MKETVISRRERARERAKGSTGRCGVLHETMIQKETKVGRRTNEYVVRYLWFSINERSQQKIERARGNVIISGANFLIGKVFVPGKKDGRQKSAKYN